MSDTGRGVLSFEQWSWDPGSRELRHRGRPRHVTPKAFELLGALLRRRGRVATKTELMSELWPEDVVNESNLARLVAELRRVLGDDPGAPRLLRTAYGLGYSFTASAALTGEGAHRDGPWLEWSGREIALGEGENLVGRGPECLVRVRSSKVSRRHASLRVRASSAVVEDLGSKNGTFVAGERIDGQVELSEGDDVAIGPAVLVFHCGGATAATETEQ